MDTPYTYTHLGGAVDAGGRVAGGCRFGRGLGQGVGRGPPLSIRLNRVWDLHHRRGRVCVYVCVWMTGVGRGSGCMDMVYGYGVWVWYMGMVYG